MLDENEWEQERSVQGCGFLFLLMLAIAVLLGFGVVKLSDNFLNNPGEQILAQLPDFVEVPDYDRKDEFPQITEVKQPSKNEKWYEIKIKTANQKRYLYLVKAVVKKKLFLQPEVKITEVVEYGE
ncbi:hypothetical protein [Enterococcus sp. BWR-S5]|uniref:hypothetical protein n=1 Tax=Enterococcus sp. BWR-S5 TaxID=2787714 RepID=UPI001922340C|nr:hypothetical protein [Enterococcus sp. BWR-S5]MBL1226397.1 hypothetical protein [Enterococcus sp. BWR-S5]